jgi:hypothetical protein
MTHRIVGAKSKGETTCGHAVAAPCFQLSRSGEECSDGEPARSAVLLLVARLHPAGALPIRVAAELAAVRPPPAPRRHGQLVSCQWV